MWCNVGFAKPVLLECKLVKESDPLYTRSDSTTDYYKYYSLDFDKKKLLKWDEDYSSDLNSFSKYNHLESSFLNESS